ncbi:MAG: thioredoxin [Clostridia bacterium]
MSAVIITKENFQKEVLEATEPVLIDFWASWCGPCRAVAPIIDSVAKEATHAKIGKINVDEQPELAAAFDVMSIPTLAVFKGGRVAHLKVGVQSKGVILQMLEA